MTIQEPIERRSSMTGAVPLTVADVPVICIEPSKGWVSLKLHELWEYRELLYFLTWRDIKVRYKQTVLGAAWAIHPALLHHGGVLFVLRQAGQDAVG